MIEIVYATAMQQQRFSIAFTPGMTLADALAAECLRGLSYVAVAIYGKRAKEYTIALTPLDRIELLQALTIDPKEARRLRAKQTA